MSIGSTCLILDKINIKYYCDCINFIQEIDIIINSNSKNNIDEKNIIKKIEKDTEKKNSKEIKVKKNKSIINKTK